MSDRIRFSIILGCIVFISLVRLWTRLLYAKIKRYEFNQQVKEYLKKLDGTPESSISLLTDIPVEEFDEYGGMPSDDGEDSGGLH